MKLSQMGKTPPGALKAAGTRVLVCVCPVRHVAFPETKLAKILKPNLTSFHSAENPPSDSYLQESLPEGANGSHTQTHTHSI